MPTVWDLTAVCLAITFGYILYSRRYTAALPPSPPRDILIGHARKIPLTNGWDVYAKWNKEYGDVVYTEALGRSMVFLNSVTAARDLLEKTGTTFSDRPYLPVFNDIGWGLTLPILRYGARFRKHRRIFHQYFSPQGITAFRHIQEHEVLKLLRRLLTSPDKFIVYVEMYISGIILSVTYGHEIVENDPYVALVEQAASMTSRTGHPGTTVLDILPFMRHAPSWLPGMGVKKLIKEGSESVKMVMTQPLRELKEKKDENIAPPCLMSELLDEYEETSVLDPEHEEDLMNIGATIYTAGSITTRSALETFFLLMTINPEVAKKAQEEIDGVVGKDRLPCLDDRKNLPYLNCILKEQYRIQPPVPFGIPHRSTQVEHYREWTIPEGTIAITNIWLMMRDEKYFSNPDTFVPERHMKMTKADTRKADSIETVIDGMSFAAEDDPSSIVFGFGRRTCPGNYFADSNLWLAMANVLSMFDIKPYVDPKTGKTEIPKLEFDSNEQVAFPKPFKCTITPRDAMWADAMTTSISTI